MASTRSVISPGVFAFSATTVIPPTPLQGVAYRNAAMVVPTVANGGWPYGVKVNSADYNQILYSYSTMLDALDKRGVLGYTNLIDYTAGAFAMGSDNVLYAATRANGPASALKDPITDIDYWCKVSAPVGQCYLSKSGANLLLAPRRGNQITIGGVQYAIPAAGVTLAPTGLLANTNYNIFAYMNAGVMTLEAVTTGHSVDAITGVEIKTGDASRTLVGKARMVVAATWIDDATHIYVLSWFNPRRKMGTAAFTATRTVAASGGFSEVNSEIRVSWLTWGVEPPQVTFTGGCFITGPAVGSFFADLDGVTPGISYGQVTATVTVPSAIIDNSFNAAEGDHYTTLFANANGGTNVGFIGGANGQVAQQVIVNG